VSVRMLTRDEVARALAVRDLTDPREGPHAMQRLVDDIVGALARAWSIDPVVVRGPRVVDVTENYDALGYEPDAVTRDARYTRYVSPSTMLRSHTSAMVPGALRRLPPETSAALVACPGVVYRRDSIDRLHSGTPHQVDLWRVDQAELAVGDLKEMIEIVVRVALPGAEWRVEPRVHPYTTSGLQIDVDNGGEWVEIGECGLAAEPVLRAAGLNDHTGLAMGLGLDRLLMLRKGIADIRLLRASDDRIASQMRDLSLYRPVSNRPAIVRDLSLAVDASDDAELLGDRVRETLGQEAEWVEAVEVVSETPGCELPPGARDRLGMGPNHKNVLVRVVLRHAERTLTREEANGLRDKVFFALHDGAHADGSVADDCAGGAHDVGLLVPGRRQRPADGFRRG
jgi:phenylalanyl-tRNA synthetase alpha chain